MGSGMMAVKGWIEPLKPQGGQYDRGMAIVFVVETDASRALQRAREEIAAKGWRFKPGEGEARPLRRPADWSDPYVSESWHQAEALGAWANLHLYPREADNPNPLS